METLRKKLLPITLEDDCIIEESNIKLSNEEIIIEWDRKMRKKFMLKLSVCKSDGVIGDILKDYLRGLKEKIGYFREKNLVKEKILSHLKFFHLLCYSNERIDTSVTNYLDYIEDILLIVCGLELDIVRFIKKVAKDYNKIIKRVGRRIIYNLTLNLLNEEKRIFHVLLKLETRQEKSWKDVMLLVYSHYLTSRPVQNRSELSFCRYYLLFEKLKSVADVNSHSALDKIFYWMFKTTPELIESNKTLKSILCSTTDSMVDLVDILINRHQAAVNAYFRLVASTTEDDDVFIPTTIDLESDEEDGGVQLFELDEKEKSDDNVLVKSELPLKNSTLYTEVPANNGQVVCIIDDDSDVEEVGVIEDTKNIIKCSGNRKPVVPQRKISFLDSIPVPGVNLRTSECPMEVDTVCLSISPVPSPMHCSLSPNVDFLQESVTAVENAPQLKVIDLESLKSPIPSEVNVSNNAVNGNSHSIDLSVKSSCDSIPKPMEENDKMSSNEQIASVENEQCHSCACCSCKRSNNITRSSSNGNSTNEVVTAKPSHKTVEIQTENLDTFNVLSGMITPPSDRTGDECSPTSMEMNNGADVTSNTNVYAFVNDLRGSGPYNKQILSCAYDLDIESHYEKRGVCEISTQVSVCDQNDDLNSNASHEDEQSQGTQSCNSPETTRDLPEATQDLAETIRDVPETTKDLPEATRDLLETASRLPETTNDSVETTSDLLETASRLAETTSDLLEATSDLSAIQEEFADGPSEPDNSQDEMVQSNVESDAMEDHLHYAQESELQMEAPIEVSVVYINEVEQNLVEMQYDSYGELPAPDQMTSDKGYADESVSEVEIDNIAGLVSEIELYETEIDYQGSDEEEATREYNREVRNAEEEALAVSSRRPERFINENGEIVNSPDRSIDDYTNLDTLPVIIAASTQPSEIESVNESTVFSYGLIMDDNFINDKEIVFVPDTSNTQPTDALTIFKITPEVAVNDLTSSNNEREKSSTRYRKRPKRNNVSNDVVVPKIQASVTMAPLENKKRRRKSVKSKPTSTCTSEQTKSAPLEVFQQFEQANKDLVESLFSASVEPLTAKNMASNHCDPSSSNDSYSLFDSNDAATTSMKELDDSNSLSSTESLFMSPPYENIRGDEFKRHVQSVNMKAFNKKPRKSQKRNLVVSPNDEATDEDNYIYDHLMKLDGVPLKSSIAAGPSKRRQLGKHLLNKKLHVNFGETHVRFIPRDTDRLISDFVYDNISTDSMTKHNLNFDDERLLFYEPRIFVEVESALEIKAKLDKLYMKSMMNGFKMERKQEVAHVLKRIDYSKTDEENAISNENGPPIIDNAVSDVRTHTEISNSMNVMPPSGYIPPITATGSGVKKKNQEEKEIEDSDKTSGGSSSTVTRRARNSSSLTSKRKLEEPSSSTRSNKRPRGRPKAENVGKRPKRKNNIGVVDTQGPVGPT